MECGTRIAGGLTGLRGEIRIRDGLAVVLGVHWSIVLVVNCASRSLGLEEVPLARKVLAPQRIVFELCAACQLLSFATGIMGWGGLKL